MPHRAIEAIVILPAHLHTIWRLPDGDADFSLRRRLLKHHLACGTDHPTHRHGEKRIWQRCFWQHVIRDEADWCNHVDYIHYKPVKHGHTDSPIEGKYSSFAKAVSKVWCAKDWGRG